MKYLILIIIIGVSLIGYSFSLEPFTDKDLFLQNYASMGPGQSEEFYQMREQLLSPKYDIQDMGISISLAAMLLLVLIKFGNGTLQSPRNKSWFVCFAVFLPLITVTGFVFDLIQGAYRYEFPHWADSLGIPLMGVPIQLGVLLIWSMAHLILLKEPKAKPLRGSISFKLNPWIMIISFLTAVLTGLMFYEGAYWYAVPGLLWLHYYLSIGVCRMSDTALNKPQHVDAADAAPM